MTLIWTYHALERWDERVGLPNPPRQLAPDSKLRRIEANTTIYEVHDRGRHYLLVTRPAEQDGRGLVVITVKPTTHDKQNRLPSKQGMPRLKIGYNRNKWKRASPED